MPFVFLGLTRDAGTSSKTQKPYDIAQVHFAIDAAASTRKDRQQAFGLEGTTLPVAPEAIEKFRNVEPLTAVNFEFEPDPGNLQRNRIVGVRPVPAAVKQAS